MRLALTFLALTHWLFAATANNVWSCEQHLGGMNMGNSITASTFSKGGYLDARQSADNLSAHHAAGSYTLANQMPMNCDCEQDECRCLSVCHASTGSALLFIGLSFSFETKNRQIKPPRVVSDLTVFQFPPFRPPIA